MSPDMRQVGDTSRGKAPVTFKIRGLNPFAPFKGKTRTYDSDAIGSIFIYKKRGGCPCINRLPGKET